MRLLSFRELIEPMTGFEVGRVLFGPSYASFDLVGEQNLFLQINKSFTISQGGTTNTYVSNAGQPQLAASSLVACIGSKVERLFVDERVMQVPFSNGSLLSVDFSPEDFEPVEVSCTHCMAPSKVVWFTTLEAE